MEMKKFIWKRGIIIIFFVILTALFLLFRLAPGDPISRMIDPTMNPEDAQQLISELGLDQPVWTQYLYYLKNFFTGHFGVSFHYGRPVLVGIFMGKIAAWHKGKRIDTFMTVGALVLHTLFLPWLALIFIWVLAYKVGWFPLTGIISPEVWTDPSAGFFLKTLDVLHHMVLPLFTLFVIHFGSYLLIMRSSMLETLREDYVLTARAKGLEEKRVRNHHAAPNAALPVITSVGLSLAFSINGGALTETVFTWPGIGRELVFSVSNNDYPLAQASFLLIALIVLLSNMVVDVLYAYLDPRIRY